MFIKKKTFILIITYLAAAAIAFGAYSAALSANGRNYRSTAVYGYEHAFGEVVTASRNLSDALHRGAYATGAEMSAAVCADVYGNCLAAGMTMAALPFSTQELEHTAEFIGIAGDYAQALMRSAAASGFDDTARASFAKLYKIADSITQSLTQLQSELDEGSVIMDEPENVFAANDENSLVSTAMLEMESGLDELPALDYDGRYTKETPPECEDPISVDEAREIAAEFLDCDEDELEKLYRSENGATSFSFEDGTVLVDGYGNVVSLSSSRAVSGDMSSEDMEKAAKKFLEDKGFDNMKMVSSERRNDVQTMRFECVENGVRCESDCIKLSIAADNGKLYSFDAVQHINRHKSHPEPVDMLTQDAAKKALPENLSFKSGSMVYAETEGGNERLCYDFECKTEDGESVSVLVDAALGTQYRIIFE